MRVVSGLRPLLAFALACTLGGLTVPLSRASPATLDFTPHGTQPGLAVGLDASGDCYGCHAGFDAAGNERRFMPHSAWSGSMMAHATRDPLFWPALDVANHDLPGVGDYCLRCHSPEGWFGGRVAKSETGAAVNGANGCLLAGDLDDYDNGNSDFGGVGCHLCHRQNESGSLPANVRHDSGNLFIDDSPDCNGDFGPCRKGPYTYPQSGIVSAPHPATYSSFVKRGEFCASCHDVTTPILLSGPAKTLITNDGVNSGIPFPVERTFSEWRNSAYADKIFVDGFADNEPNGDAARFGATCQSCHMPSSSSPLARACQQNAEGSRTDNLPVHEFAGANVWVLGLINTLYGNALGRIDELAQGVQFATTMLTQRSATLALTLDSFGGAGQTLTARVRVTNLSGHKLPTGYAEGRRMWLQVEARDANGALFYSSGAYNSATGVLTEDPAAKVYEVQQGNWNSGSGQCDIRDGSNRRMFHFATSDCIRMDNRIPPLGFTGASNPEIRPVNYSYPETAPGSGKLVNYDDSVYAIAVPPGTPTPINVQVRLQHQVASKEYIEFLNNEALENGFQSENQMCGRPSMTPRPGPANQTRAQFMFDLWTANGRSPPLTMAMQSASTATR